MTPPGAQAAVLPSLRTSQNRRPQLTPMRGRGTAWDTGQAGICFNTPGKGGQMKSTGPHTLTGLKPGTGSTALSDPTSWGFFSFL